MRSMRAIVMLTLGFLSCLPFAMISPAHVDKQQRFVIRAKRFLDVRTGRMINSPAIVVEANKIISLDGSGAMGAGEVLDLGDRTLLPGLIDLHTHLSIEFKGDWAHRPVDATAADDALLGARNARKVLRTGFTTVRDLGS